ncbi:MAG TPA: RNA polymerase sigma factor [Saprospiraceae bacterium]|nr:RNA polymerase sigma factor [Saprospiraceae bacterium]
MTDTLLQACKNGDRIAQRKMYELLKGKMFVVCQRYANSREDAEDLLQEGFVKMFRDLHQYQGIGHLEGWIRMVFVRVCLQYIKKQKAEIKTVEFTDLDIISEEEVHFNDENTVKNMIKMLQLLPTGFRTVFNLYVLEGYSHPEIAEIMGISVGTSKSQLLRAKAYFKKMLEKSLINK